MTLVLSIFPGIDLLGAAFERKGACVVRGPDPLWGGDIRAFHPPQHRFDGIIGGPPCQRFSRAAAHARKGGQTLAADMIPEFERVVIEAMPTWFVMENVPEAPLPHIARYSTRDYVINNRDCGGTQNRVRRFTFGMRGPAAPPLDLPPLFVPQAMGYEPTVTANAAVWDPVLKRSEARRTAAYFRMACRAQGLPDDFELPPFTVAAAIRAVGNGVPMPMGEAVAHAVLAAVAQACTCIEGNDMTLTTTSVMGCAVHGVAA